MRAEASVVQLTRIATPRVLLAALVTAGCVVLPATASGAVSSGGFQLDGQGVQKAGREVGLSVSVLNTATDKSKVPELIRRVKLSSGPLRFNSNAAGLKICTAKLRNDGTAMRCPRASKVGKGMLSGFLGTPGGPVDSFGALSAFSGRFSLFNYKHSARAPARLLVVITTKKPFAGIAINLLVLINRDHDVIVDFPVLSELPKVIRNSYPSDTKLVLGRFAVNVSARRSRGSKPFMWLRTTRELGMKLEAFGG